MEVNALLRVSKIKSKLKKIDSLFSQFFLLYSVYDMRRWPFKGLRENLVSYIPLLKS